MGCQVDSLDCLRLRTAPPFHQHKIETVEYSTDLLSDLIVPISCNCCTICNSKQSLSPVAPLTTETIYSHGTRQAPLDHHTTLNNYHVHAAGMMNDKAALTTNNVASFGFQL